MNNKIFAFLLFFHVCISAFSNEIELTIHEMMKTINDLKINYFILNTTNSCEFEIFERISNDFKKMDVSIENVAGKLRQNKSMHISLPLAMKIKNIINELNCRQDNIYDVGNKSFVGVFQCFEDLNILFDLLNDLRWVLANFPLTDINAWIVETGLNISYNKIKESINIFAEIQDGYFRPYLGSPYYNQAVYFEKIYLLLDIVNDNLDSIFCGILMHELNILEGIIRDNDDTLSGQLIKLEGLYQYINFIILMDIGEN